MKRNMDLSLGLIYSQQVMLALVDKGLSREEAYNIVQPLAMEAWEKQKSFLPIVLAASEVGNWLSPEEVKACFDYNRHLKHLDLIFSRLGLE